MLHFTQQTQTFNNTNSMHITYKSIHSLLLYVMITPSLQRHTITASHPYASTTCILNHTNLQPSSLFTVSHRHLTLTLTIGIISSMTQSHIYLEHYIHSHRQLNILKITQHQKHLTMLSVAYMVPPHLPSLETPTPSPHTYIHCFTSQCIPHSNSYYLKQPYILLIFTFKPTKHFWGKSKTCSGLLISDIFLGIDFFLIFSMR